MPKSTNAKSLFLKDDSSFGGLSRIAGALLITSQNALDCLAREINEIARRARVSRQWELCNKASSAVLSMPVSQGLRGVADFYANLSRHGDTPEFRKSLDGRADRAEPPYVARIILALGCTYDLEGSLSEALRYYVEAAKAANGTDSLTAVQAAASMAVIRSEYGDHLGSLRDMRDLFSVIGSISHTYPHVYYEYANNLAVVLSRAGRTEEARQAIKVAVASPLAPQFPEWHDTAREIEEAARKEPRRESPTFRITAAEVRRPAANQAPLRKTPLRKTRNRQSIFLIAVAGRAKPAIDARIVSKNRRITSLLQRYVKTVRIRDRP
jgi:tetratricopeptide (TPR) repeat protein